MTDLTSTGRVSAPWIVDAPVLPMPDDSGWTWVDIGILSFVFGCAVAPSTALMIWALT